MDTHRTSAAPAWSMEPVCLFFQAWGDFYFFMWLFFAIVDRNNVPIKAVSVEPTHHELNLRPVSRSNLNNLNNVWSSQWWSLSLMTYFIWKNENQILKTFWPFSPSINQSSLEDCSSRVCVCVCPLFWFAHILFCCLFPFVSSQVFFRSSTILNRNYFMLHVRVKRNKTIFLLL